MAKAAAVELGEDEFLFTSESVNEGHPDKLCDLVSDAVLDACLAQDANSYVACETAAKTGMVMIFGEITTSAKVDYEAVVREAIRDIGYDAADKGLDYRSCSVVVAIEQQSADIAQSVHGNLTKSDEDLGAGDQGIMFGYASDETPELMPLSAILATKLGRRLTAVRKKGVVDWVRPDGKTQVTVVYRKVKGRMVPQRVHTVLISTQHRDGVSNERIRKDLMEEVVRKVIPNELLTEDTIFHLNPSGRFVIGGPHGDAGLTGRKIIVDTYGGWGAHGGGAFSGKDPSKVDRSAAYAARWIAKSLVASDLCARCLVQLSYAIGVAKPLSIYVDTYDTNKVPIGSIYQAIDRHFDLRPGIIRKELRLCRPIYSKTACYGHFGRDDPDFLWEKAKNLKVQPQ